MNLEALYGDGTSSYVVPAEPLENETVTLRFRPELPPRPLSPDAGPVMTGKMEAAGRPTVKEGAGEVPGDTR